MDAGQVEEIERSVARYADMLAAMGTEPRLQIMRLLLGAHPDGLVVGEIMGHVPGSPSTLSHHLEKLRVEGLVTVQRQGKYLRYRANSAALRELLVFFWAECCKRNPVVDPRDVVGRCGSACSGDEGEGAGGSTDAPADGGADAGHGAGGAGSPR